MPGEKLSVTLTGTMSQGREPGERGVSQRGLKDNLGGRNATLGRGSDTWDIWASGCRLVRRRYIQSKESGLRASHLRARSGGWGWVGHSRIAATYEFGKKYSYSPPVTYLH